MFKHSTACSYFLGGIWEVPALPQHPPVPPRPILPPHPTPQSKSTTTTEPQQAFLLTNDLWMCLPACLSVIVYKMCPSLASIWSLSMSKYCCLLYSFESFAVFNRISMFFNPFFLYDLIYLYLFEEIFLNAFSRYCIVGSSVCVFVTARLCVCVRLRGCAIDCSFQYGRAHTCWCMTVWILL